MGSTNAQSERILLIVYRKDHEQFWSKDQFLRYYLYAATVTLLRVSVLSWNKYGGDYSDSP